MSIFEKIAENKIREAIENGDFERLGNKGQPLHLDEYFATPEDFRVGHSVLKSANVLPTEIELIREVGWLNQQIERCEDEEERRRLKKNRDEKQLQLRITLERNKRK
ncbi:MAG: DUF1992 domain-containing protein [Acidobacteria bacterium]|nr:DUF1992 domain-containing protein [Acidobacteriota bacterium]